MDNRYKSLEEPELFSLIPFFTPQTTFSSYMSEMARISELPQQSNPSSSNTASSTDIVILSDTAVIESLARTDPITWVTTHLDGNRTISYTTKDESLTAPKSLFLLHYGRPYLGGGLDYTPKEQVNTPKRRRSSYIILGKIQGRTIGKAMNLFL